MVELQPVRDEPEQLGRGGQVPERAGRVDMPHVCRQQRQPGLDVDAVAIPLQQRPDSKACRRSCGSGRHPGERA